MATRPWLPTDLGSSLAAWWDASDLPAGKVAQWTAKGSLALVASQATTSSQPTAVSSGRNGKPAVVFDGSGSFLSFNPASLPTGDMTGAVAAYMNAGINPTNWRRVFGYGTGDNSNSFQIIRRGSTTKVGEFSVGDSAVDWTDVDRFVEVTKAGTVGTLYVDAVSSKNGTFASALSGSNGFIGRGVQFSDNWPGSIQQIVVVNRALSASELQQLEGWESWYDGKNGANLPAGHPYKAAAPTVDTGGASDATAPSATLPAAVSFLPGAASATTGATAPGTTFFSTVSLVPGVASSSANATAPGAIFTVTAALASGAASGQTSTTAPGSTLSVTAALIPGAASSGGSMTAPGAVLPVASVLVPGLAGGIGNVTASGAVIANLPIMIPGAAGEPLPPPGPVLETCVLNDFNSVCDRCGFRYNPSRLSLQHQWAGNKLVNLHLLVCDRCLDKPQEQLRDINLPADPPRVVDLRSGKGGPISGGFSVDF